MRLGFVVALLLVMSSAVIWHVVRDRPTEESVVVKQNVMCTPLDAETRIREPGLTDVDRVTCLAVAGKIDAARTRLLAMLPSDRGAAIQNVFEIAHPIADRGDDRSAGPIMALVVEFWPENYMAVFHAGMAEFALGHDIEARIQLERFLTMYTRQDIWRQRAQKAIADIEAKAPLDRRESQFPH